MLDIAVAFAVLVLAGVAMTLGANDLVITSTYVATFLVYRWVA